MKSALKKIFAKLISPWLKIDNNRIKQTSLMVSYIVQNQFLNDENFCLIDVGASGGIAGYWDVFGKYLTGFGFEPLIKECERLNSQDKYPQFKYLPYYIIAEKEDIDNPLIDPAENNNLFIRSSAYAVTRILNINYSKEIFNQGEEITLTKHKISLDRFCSEQKVKTVDFLKTDTDGFDYAVLRGAEQLLSEGSLLGVLIECNLSGFSHPYSNTFRNIDSFLIGKGFSLFDLSAWRYTKEALPGKFMYKIPAQTVSGQIWWGDALYLKDLIRMKNNGQQIPTIQILKMACLQELFGLPDCAAELLVVFRDQLSSVIDVDHCLDLLAKDMGLYSSYREHLAQFQNNPASFYPS